MKELQILPGIESFRDSLRSTYEDRSRSREGNGERPRGNTPDFYWQTYGLRRDDTTELGMSGLEQHVACPEEESLWVDCVKILHIDLMRWEHLAFFHQANGNIRGDNCLSKLPHSLCGARRQVKRAIVWGINNSQKQAIEASRTRDRPAYDLLNAAIRLPEVRTKHVPRDQLHFGLASHTAKAELISVARLDLECEITLHEWVRWIWRRTNKFKRTQIETSIERARTANKPDEVGYLQEILGRETGSTASAVQLAEQSIKVAQELLATYPPA